MNPFWYEDYLGLPWALGGRDRNGIDCWGLVRLVHKELLGIELPSWIDDPHALDSTFRGRMKAFDAHKHEFLLVPKGEERPFDIASLTINGCMWHVGLLVSRPFNILHIEDEEGSVLSDWSRREDFLHFGGFYRAV